MAGFPKAPRRRRGGILAALVLLLPFGLLVLPTTIIAIAGLIPTAVALVVDRDPEKPAALCVGAMNFCGIMPFLIQLWQRGHTGEIAFSLLLSPTTWLTMYGAAAIGWGIYYLVPPMVAGLSTSRYQAQIRQLEETRGILVADWGPEVAGKHMERQDEAEDTGGAAPETPPEDAAKAV